MKQVRCIDNSGPAGKLEVGGVYDVTDEGETYYFIAVPEGVNVFYSKHRFETVNETSK